MDTKRPGETGSKIDRCYDEIYEITTFRLVN